ncbi:MAG: 5'-methylthioadenosine/S-adenosylhomocysteine nucleosidase [Oscillospiraceae bacterium]|nr:5'-methylthioadenosine/S-adenosylhomocysteine nucleosidase [Oscillospiraceae bacterium]
MLGIITAMPCEAAPLLARMDGCTTAACGGYLLQCGSLCGMPARVLICGVGRLNAGLGAQALLQTSVSALLHIGTAGALDPAVQPGDCIAASALTWSDFSGWSDELLLPMRRSYPADPALLALARQDSQCHVGIIATGDRLIADPARRREIHARTGALAADMESAAVAHAAMLADVPLLVLRAVTDRADGHAVDDFAQNCAAASQRAADAACALLTRGAPLWGTAK